MSADLPKPLAPLPINVRPRLGETTIHYVQRLARANHLRTSYLLWILSQPTRTRNLRLRIDRLAALSGRSVEILKITLADTDSTQQPDLGPASRRWERIATTKARDRTFNIIGQMKNHASWSQSTLRQISDTWKVPEWLVKRILSPRFPNRAPVGRVLISEDHHSKLAALYEEGMTAAQAWYELIDNHDTWIKPSAVQHHFALFDLTRGTTLTVDE
ncbi:hypothetical protein [Streptomyces sp. SM11]|uniref:hypothetical protein n=1 Tax=Streptomyces sp. SM11 TaxID=565557 RepID=UPI0011B02A39|nr:hypothetical protein [Streptomyces sp. SM11]